MLSFDDDANLSSYTRVFDPPEGFAFSEALGAAYSLNPAFVLQIPVHLANGGLGRRERGAPLLVFEAARRRSAAISVFVQNSRILVPEARANQLFGLVDKMVVAVEPPDPAAVFHAKFWIVRFVSRDGGGGGEVFHRLAVLTRNMTGDRCRDLSLRLEGRPEDRIRGFGVNAPLAELVAALPGLAAKPFDPAHADRAERLAREIARVRWERPGGVDDLAFFVHGLGRSGWRPPECGRMVAVSPFCAQGALDRLVESAGGEAVALVSRPETLDELGADALSGFGRLLVIDETLELAEDYDDESGGPGESGESGEPDESGGPGEPGGPDGSVGTGGPGDSGGEEASGPPRPLATGLHAKLYLFEVGRADAVLVVGSANATEAGLPAERRRGPRNVELLVQLSGKRRALGAVDDLLGSGGLGGHLVDYSPAEKAAEDPLLAEARGRIEEARRALARADLKVRCLKTKSPEVWGLELSGDWPDLGEGVEAAVWPITVPGDGAAVVPGGGPARRGRGAAVVPLGEFTTASLTGLIAFRIRLLDGPPGSVDLSAVFVLNLPVEGMPQNRDGAILSSLVKDEASFLRYLELLCDAEEDWFLLDRREEAAPAPQEDGDGPGAGGRSDGAPILEKLTRLYCRDPEKLGGISELVRDMIASRAEGALGRELVEFWSVFEKALEE